MIDLLLPRILIAIAGAAVAAYWDYKKGIIPDTIPAVMVLFALIFALLEGTYVLLGLGVLVLLIGIIIHKKLGIGGGDIKLLAALATLIPLTMAVIYIFIFAGVLQAAYSMYKKTKEKEGIKMAPFILIATIIVVVFLV